MDNNAKKVLKTLEPSGTQVMIGGGGNEKVFWVTYSKSSLWMQESNWKKGKHMVQKI